MQPTLCRVKNIDLQFPPQVLHSGAPAEQKCWKMWSINYHMQYDNSILSVLKTLNYKVTAFHWADMPQTLHWCLLLWQQPVAVPHLSNSFLWFLHSPPVSCLWLKSGTWSNIVHNRLKQPTSPSGKASTWGHLILGSFALCMALNTF